MNNIEYLCLDCGVDTLSIGEYYMVNSIIWSKSKLGPYDGMLCIACLENRIGFVLNKFDFTNVPANNGSAFYQSKKLKSRLNNGHKRNNETMLPSIG